VKQFSFWHDAAPLRFWGNEPQVHQPAGRIVDERQRRAGLAAGLESGMFRAADLNQFTQTVAPPARLMRRGQPKLTSSRCRNQVFASSTVAILNQ
jgi:hypothetical protein